jgi:ubiquinone/menaquinone biosynthesis C-methylase UbiE
MSWDKKDMIKWYDEYANDRRISDDQIVSVQSGRYKRIAHDIDQLILSLNLNDNDYVLDAGCGAARFISRLRRTKACGIVGVDASRNMIRRAKERAPYASYVLADVLNLPFRKTTFTVVVCLSVLWHIPSERSRYINYDIYERGLQEIKRVLAKGGLTVFNISNPFHLQSIIDFLGDLTQTKLHKNVELRNYKLPLGMAKRILTKLGLVPLDVVATGFYPMLLETFYIPFHRPPSEERINRYYDSFERLGNLAWIRRVLQPFAETFVVKAINVL